MMQCLCLAAWCLSLLLTGCASLPNAQVGQLNGRPLEFVARPGNGPVVVFENGLGAQMEWWSKVLPALPPQTTYFVYNRPGYGHSAAADTPRDGQHIVAELRSALQGQGLRPPYVLVGHSMGGLYMQLFARQHPLEVFALVLVDSTHPRQLEGDGAMDRQPLLIRGLAKALITGTARAEFDQLSHTGQQVLSLPAPDGMPVQVLSAAQSMKETSDLARFYNDLRRDIAHLHPGSTQVWVDSGHAIPLEQPSAVVDAIRAVLR